MAMTTTLAMGSGWRLEDTCSNPTPAAMVCCRWSSAGLRGIVASGGTIRSAVRRSRRLRFDIGNGWQEMEVTGAPRLFFFSQRLSASCREASNIGYRGGCFSGGHFSGGRLRGSQETRTGLGRAAGPWASRLWAMACAQSFNQPSPASPLSNWEARARCAWCMLAICAQRSRLWGLMSFAGQDTELYVEEEQSAWSSKPLRTRTAVFVCAIRERSLVSTE